jgi:hypothetical protein
MRLYFRQRSSNVTTHGFYVGEHRPDDDTASERYMKMEENIYEEPGNVSVDYINPVDGSAKTKSGKDQERTEKISSILYLLKRKRKAPILDKTEVKYVDIMETGSGPTPPLTMVSTTTSTCTMTTPSLPLETEATQVPAGKTKSQQYFK